MTLDLEALTAVAKAATPGPWAPRLPSKTVVVAKYPDGRTCGEVVRTVSGSLNSHREANATFIAAFNPATALALIEEVNRLRGVVEGVVDAVAYTEGEGGRRSYGLRPSFGPAFQAARAALTPEPDNGSRTEGEG